MITCPMARSQVLGGLQDAARGPKGIKGRHGIVRGFFRGLKRSVFLTIFTRGRAKRRVNELWLSIRKVDQLNSIDGDMYPPNQPKPKFGQLGLTK